MHYDKGPHILGSLVGDLTAAAQGAVRAGDCGEVVRRSGRSRYRRLPDNGLRAARVRGEEIDGVLNRSGGREQGILQRSAQASHS